MREYNVRAIMTTVLETTIVANSQEEAEALARETDGGDFSAIEQEGSWSIDSVIDIGESDEDA